MKEFGELVLKHKGKRICIMGGAPSLEDDLIQIEADVYISTNGHGCGLVSPDYLFAMDEANGNQGGVPMGGYLRGLSDAPIISPRGYADYYLTDWPQAPRDVLSGMVAAWAAYMMGAKVVILAGMDGYQKSGFIGESVKMARDIHCPVRVMSDELTKAWPRYDPAEKFGRYKPHPDIETKQNVDGMTIIECVKATNFRGSPLNAGQRVKVSRHEVRRLLKHKMVIEVSDG